MSLMYDLGGTRNPYGSLYNIVIYNTLFKISSITNLTTSANIQIPTAQSSLSSSSTLDMTEHSPSSPVKTPVKTPAVTAMIPDPTTPSPIPPTSTLTRLETSLNKQQERAFSSLTRLFHMSPTLATAFSSIYRTALGSHTAVRTFAECNGYDTVWLWWIGAIVAYAGLFATEIGMVMIEKLVGLGKGLLWVPMVGIPVWKAGRRRGLGEVVEFFLLGGKEGGRGEREGGR